MNKLRTFVLVDGGKVISPALVTTREYGRWLSEEYGEYVYRYELYLKSKAEDETVLEWHPGTKIGQWFDRQEFNDGKFYSWFILQDSSIMNRLVKSKLAYKRDAIPISVTDLEKRRMLRVYTVDQIELYIRSVIKDTDFRVSTQMCEPIMIKIKSEDRSKLVIPKIRKAKKSLF